MCHWGSVSLSLSSIHTGKQWPEAYVSNLFLSVLASCWDMNPRKIMHRFLSWFWSLREVILRLAYSQLSSSVMLYGWMWLAFTAVSTTWDSTVEADHNCPCLVLLWTTLLWFLWLCLCDRCVYIKYEGQGFTHPTNLSYTFISQEPWKYVHTFLTCTRTLPNHHRHTGISHSGASFCL